MFRWIDTMSGQQSIPNAQIKTKQSLKAGNTINESTTDKNDNQAIDKDYDTFVLNIIHQPNTEYELRVTDWDTIMQIIWDFKCDCGCKGDDTVCLCSLDYCGSIYCNESFLL